MASNEEARNRLIQLGEKPDSIYIIGSPDIDLMLSNKLPDIDYVRAYYQIPFKEYGILMYHPVTTEHDEIGWHIREVVDGVIESGKNYIVIYPNNDYGTEIILNEYSRFKNMSNIKVYPSIRFEYFLSLLRNARFMIGNSSAGIRETGLYGVPAIDIGTRQKNRYSLAELTNVQWVSENKTDICKAIDNVDKYRKPSIRFGDGTSTEKFMNILASDIWDKNLQKQFYDLEIKDNV